MVSRTTRVSFASGERSRSTVGPSISWCLKFGFWLGYGLGLGPGLGFWVSSESKVEEESLLLVERNLMGGRNWEGLKIGGLGLLEMKLVIE